MQTIIFTECMDCGKPQRSTSLFCKECEEKHAAARREEAIAPHVSRSPSVPGDLVKKGIVGGAK